MDVNTILVIISCMLASVFLGTSVIKLLRVRQSIKKFGQYKKRWIWYRFGILGLFFLCIPALIFMLMNLVSVRANFWITIIVMFATGILCLVISLWNLRDNYRYT